MKKLKLAHRKTWFTLREAAAYLSLVFDEPVTEQDIIQFALEGQLSISYLARRLMVIKIPQKKLDYSFFRDWSEKWADTYEQGEFIGQQAASQDDFVTAFRNAVDYFASQHENKLEEMNLTFSIPIDPGDGVRFVDGIYTIKATENIRELMLDFVQGKKSIDDGFLLFDDGTKRIIVPDYKQWIIVDDHAEEYVVLIYRFETTKEEFDGKVRSVTKKSYISPSSTPPQSCDWIVQQKHLMQFEASINAPRAQPALDGVSITLPHMTKTLSAVFEIMQKNWSVYDPQRAPKQTNIAHEIDHALGWNPRSTGEPSRGAQTLAAAIRPDHLTEADQRVKKSRLDN